MVVSQRASRISSHIDPGVEIKSPTLGDKGYGYPPDPSKDATATPYLGSRKTVKYFEEKENARKRYGNKRTLTWDELPEWMQENVWIRSGYRVPMYSYWKCLKS